MDVVGKKIVLPEAPSADTRTIVELEPVYVKGGVTKPPKASAPAADNRDPPCEEKTGGPVNLANGDKYLEEFDFTAAGIHALDHSRRYHSKPVPGTMFGPKWIGSFEYPRLAFSGCVPDPYDPYLTPCQPQTIQWTNERGASYSYQRIDYGTYGLSASLTSVSAGLFYYDHPNQQVTLSQGKTQYVYDMAGRLLYLKKNEFTYFGFSYDSGGRLLTVTNSGGQYVTFNWINSGSNSRVASIVDTGGNTWSYGYTDGPATTGRLTSVYSPLGDVRSYHYEDPSDDTLVTGISISGVRFSTYSYDGSKRVLTSTQPGGELSDSFIYGTNSTTVTDALGQQTTYTFTPSQGGLKLANVSRAASSSCPSAVAATAYDANGWVDYTLDWKGNRTEYTYDAEGRMLDMTTASGTPRALKTVHQWSGDNIVQTEYRTATGTTYLRIEYGYYTSGWAVNELQSVKYVDVATGAQRLHTYNYYFDPYGRLTYRVDSQGLPSGVANTTYAYDVYGRLTSVTNAVGHVTTFSLHDGMGYPGRVTDPNGVITNVGYNARGGLNWQVAYVNGGARTASYFRDSDGNVGDVVHSSGRIDRYRYSNFRRVAAVGNAQNEFVQLGYAPSTLDLQTSSTRHQPSFSGGMPIAVAGGSFATYGKVDSLGRVRQESGNVGQQVNYAYDLNGNLTSRSDAQSRVTSYSYDEQDRVVSMTAPDAGTTSYGYDAQGLLASVTDPRGNVTSYAYNGFGEIVSKSSPDSGATSYTYDAAGRQASMSKANGVVISYSYDALSRLTSRTSGGFTDLYTYDEGTYGKGRRRGSTTQRARLRGLSPRVVKSSRRLSRPSRRP